MTQEVTESEKTVHAVFQQRINEATDTDLCAHATFPEVTDSPVAFGGQQSIMDAVVEKHDELGRLMDAGVITPEEATPKLAAYVDHALVIAMALGMALGAATALDAASEPVPDALPADWASDDSTDQGSI